MDVVAYLDLLKLPNEMLSKIFESLESPDLLNLKLVNNRFNVIINETSFLHSKIGLSYSNSLFVNISTKRAQQECLRGMIASGRVFEKVRLNESFCLEEFKQSNFEIISQLGDHVKHIKIEKFFDFKIKFLVQLCHLLPKLETLTIDPSWCIGHEEEEVEELINPPEFKNLTKLTLWSQEHETDVNFQNFFSLLPNVTNLVEVKTDHFFTKFLCYNPKLKILHLCDSSYLSLGNFDNFRYNDFFDVAVQHNITFKLTSLTLQLHPNSSFPTFVMLKPQLGRFLEKQTDIVSLQIQVQNIKTLLDIIIQMQQLRDLEINLYETELPEIFTFKNSSVKNLIIRVKSFEDYEPAIWKWNLDATVQFAESFLATENLTIDMLFSNNALMQVPEHPITFEVLEKLERVDLSLRYSHNEDIQGDDHNRGIIGKTIPFIMIKKLKKFVIGHFEGVSWEEWCSFMKNNPEMTHLEIQQDSKSFVHTNFHLMAKSFLKQLQLNLTYATICGGSCENEDHDTRCNFNLHCNCSYSGCKCSLLEPFN